MLDFKFITAHFINNEKTTVESLWKDSDENVHADVTEAEEGNLAWEEVLKHTTLDEIHENTINNIREQHKDFKELVIKIANEDGLIHQVNQVEKTKLWPSLIEAVFNNKENDEDLFALKLALFEVETIRGSTNAAVKTKLRKSKTKFDILRFAFEIAEEVVVEPKKKVTKKK
jgi:hypothetical protein